MKVVSYFCTNCNYRFESEKEYEEHLQYCQKPYPVKGIFLYKCTDKEENPFIQIVYYNNAILYGKNTIQLVKNSRYIEPIKIDKLHLEEFHHIGDGDYFGVYTTDFSDEHEQECIKKLLEYYKETIISYIESMEKNLKDWKEYLKDYDNKKPEVNINKECKMIFEEFD